jgi:hypothetical protein
MKLPGRALAFLQGTAANDFTTSWRLTLGPAGELQLDFDDIAPDERHEHFGEKRLASAPPCRMRALRHAQLFCSQRRRGATPTLTNSFEDLRPNELSHPRY